MLCLTLAVLTKPVQFSGLTLDWYWCYNMDLCLGAGGTASLVIVPGSLCSGEQPALAASTQSEAQQL